MAIVGRAQKRKRVEATQAGNGREHSIVTYGTTSGKCGTGRRAAGLCVKLTWVGTSEYLYGCAEAAARQDGHVTRE